MGNNLESKVTYKQIRSSIKWLVVLCTIFITSFIVFLSTTYYMSEYYINKIAVKAIISTPVRRVVLDNINNYNRSDSKYELLYNNRSIRHFKNE